MEARRDGGKAVAQRDRTEARSVGEAPWAGGVSRRSAERQRDRG